MADHNKQLREALFDITKRNPLQAYVYEKIDDCLPYYPCSFSRCNLRFHKFDLFNKQHSTILSKISRVFDVIKPDELTGIKIQKTPGFSDEAWVQQEKA